MKLRCYALWVLCFLCVACQTETTTPPAPAQPPPSLSGEAAPKPTPLDEPEAAPVITASVERVRHAQGAWSARVEMIQSSNRSVGVYARRIGEDSFTPVESGMALPVGTTLQTSGTSRAIIILDEGGRLVLDHATELVLSSQTAHSAKLNKGRVVFEIDPGAEAPAQVITPHGAFSLHASRASVTTSSEEATAVVTRGQVSAKGSAETSTAGPGESLSLKKDRPAQTHATPDLGAQIAWAAIDEDAALEAIPRGLGSLFAQEPGGGTPLPLDITTRSVDVKINGVMAYTEITETFHNPSGRTLEGVYRFPLPEGAQISRLSLLVEGKWQEGVFVENARAERVWKSLIRDWRDPAWLRWQHGNQFELKIFPITPKSERKVRIGFTQRLDATAKGRRYTYPMPVDNGEQIVGRFDFSASLPGVKASAIQVSGYPDHTTSDASGRAEVSLHAESFNAMGDLSIDVTRSESKSELQSATYSDPKHKNEEGYALLTLRPDLSSLRNDTQPRDLVIITDTSYSSRGKTMKMQNAIVERILREMDPGDRVAVITCNEQCTPAAGGLKNPSAQLARDVKASLDSTEAAGTSNPIEALRVAKAIFARRDPTKQPQRAARVVYFTDGVASSGVLDASALSSAAQRVLNTTELRLTPVHMGGSVDSLALEALARAGGGAVVKLEPGVNLSRHALDILAHQYGAVLRDVTLSLPDGVELIYPRDITSLAAGSELIITARIPRSTTSGQMSLNGRSTKGAFQKTWDVTLTPSSDPGNAFIPRMWAEQRLRALQLDSPTQSRAEIVALSQQHGLVSRYTSLLALENEEMRREFGLRRGKDRTQWRGDTAPNTTEQLAATTPDAKAQEALSALRNLGISNAQDGSIGGLKGFSSGNGVSVDGLGLGGVGGGSGDGIGGGGSGGGIGGGGSGGGIGGGGSGGGIGGGGSGIGKGKGKGMGKPSSKNARGFSMNSARPGTLNVSKTKVKGSLDAKVVKRVVKQRKKQLNQCFIRSQQRGTLQGRSSKLVISWTINEEGRVQEVKTRQNTTGNQSLQACLMHRIKRWRFPATTSATQVLQSLIFKTSNHKPHRRRPRSSLTFKSPQPPSKKHLEKIDALRLAVAADLDSPKARKDLIRALSLADQYDAAWTAVEEWLARNPMDTEALILAAEIRGRQALLQEGERYVRDAIDVAPRAKWLQERMHRAYTSTDRHALACAQSMSLESLKRGSAPDPLTCPIASDLSWLPPAPNPTGLAALTAPSSPKRAPTTATSSKAPKAPRGGATISISWTGDADIDLGLIEPSGRLRTSYSAESRHHFSGVRASNSEHLVIDDLKSGTHHIDIMRFEHGKDPVTVTVTVEAFGQRKSTHVRLEGQRATAWEIKKRN